MASGISFETNLVIEDLIALTKLEEKRMDRPSSSVARQLVDTEILYLLKFGRKSGYELRKHLLRSFAINISYGTLYPHLRSLEKSHLIEGVWQQKESSLALRKRVYSLTPEGVSTLISSVRNLSDTALTMQFVLSDVNLSEELTQSVEIGQVLETAGRFFSSLGYDVTKNVAIKGSSGIEHVVEIFATRSVPKLEKLILKITREDLTIGYVMKLRALASDISASKAIIVTLGNADEEVMKLASFHGIVVCKGPEWFQEVMRVNE